MANNKISNPKKRNILQRFPFGWIFAVIILVMLFNSLSVPISGVPKEISYSDFYKALKEHPEKIKAVTKTENVLQGDFMDNSRFYRFFFGASFVCWFIPD